jgi:phosphatidylglycerophosphatase A
VWASTEAIRLFGTKDPSVVVVDEVAGQFVTLWLAWVLGPAPSGGKALIGFLALGFVLFRLLDIFKPYPIRKFEQLKGGWGIMADDLAAGVVAALILYILF